MSKPQLPNLHKNLSMREAQMIAREYGATVEQSPAGDVAFKHPDAPRFVRVSTGRKDAGPQVINFLKHITGQRKATLTGRPILTKPERLMPGTFRHAIAKGLLLHPEGISTARLLARIGGMTMKQVSDNLSSLRALDLVAKDGNLWRPTAELAPRMPDETPAPPKTSATSATPASSPASTPPAAATPAATPATPATNGRMRPYITPGSKRYAVAEILVAHPKGLTASELAELAAGTLTAKQARDTVKTMQYEDLSALADNRWQATPRLIERMPTTDDQPPQATEPDPQPVTPPAVELEPPRLTVRVPMAEPPTPKPAPEVIVRKAAAPAPEPVAEPLPAPAPVVIEAATPPAPPIIEPTVPEVEAQIQKLDDALELVLLQLGDIESLATRLRTELAAARQRQANAELAAAVDLLNATLKAQAEVA